MKEVSGGKEDKFPEKCAYLRRKKKELLLFVAVSVFCDVSFGFAIWSGWSEEEGLVGMTWFLLLLIAVTDVLVGVVYVKRRKRLERYKRVYPLEIEREYTYPYRSFTKRYYFKVTCSGARGRIFGITEALYSKKDALRAEEMFRKEELRVFYDPEAPEGSGGRFIFPDV